MATAWTNQGPLDDYLQEFHEIGGHLMDERPVASSSRFKEVPGQWRDEPGRDETEYNDAFFLTPPSLFPEQFKYLICSSALLDPGLVGVGSRPMDAKDSWLHREHAKIGAWISEGKRRPDIAGAGAVLVLAVGYCAGVGVTLLLVALAFAAAFWCSDEPPVASSPQGLAFESLKGFIEEAANLDREITLALEVVLQHRPALTEPLRLHLHRLSQSLTESFSAAYSALVPLATPSDLAVFLEMYGLPEPTRKRRQPPPLEHRPHQSQDRFTSIPPRTPRQSKRASWNAGRLDTPARKLLTSGLFSPPSSLPTLSPPGLLPSAMDRSLGKRSSLQSLPYYPPDSDGSEIALERSSSVGRKAWRPKAYQLSPLRTSRSDPPLTHPSLKAAFYAAHLKRQRVACCLLALRFRQEPGIETARYWLQVRAVLESLRGDCKDERSRLDFRVDKPASILLPSQPHHVEAAQLDDFAPRLSDPQLMARQLESLESTLHTAAASLRAVSLNDHSFWELRDDIGAIVREWERGREVMERMRGPPEIPPFMKAWSESPPPATPPLPLLPSPTSSPARSDDDVGEHLLSSASPASLPLPGADVVFEGFAACAERFKRQPVPMLPGGMVVDELKDVIGLIKKRKGYEKEQKEQHVDEKARWTGELPSVDTRPCGLMALPPPPRRSDREAGLIE